MSQFLCRQFVLIFLYICILVINKFQRFFLIINQIREIFMLCSLSINQKNRFYQNNKTIIVTLSNPSDNSTPKPLPEISNPISNRHFQNQQQPQQPKLFKIRTFSSKITNPKMNRAQIRQIQKDLILTNNNEINEASQKMKSIKNVHPQRSYVSYKTNHIANSKSNLKFKAKQNANSCLFDGISINKLEYKYIKPQIYNLSKLAPLSHKPFVIFNDKSVNNNLKDIVLILSMKTLNYQPIKYFKDVGGYSSRNSRKRIEQNEPLYSIQTATFLKALSHPGDKPNFLNKCKIFYKVSSLLQLNNLKDYLDINNLTNYQGIIDVSNKHCQQYVIYSLKGIISDQDTVLIIEEEQTLKYEFPLLERDNAIIFANGTKGANNYFMINQIINHLKDIQVKEEIEMFPSEIKKIQYKIQNIQEDKENINPNYMNSTFKELKSTAKKSKMSPAKTNPKKQRRQFIISANISKNKLQLFQNSLSQRLTQAKNIKFIKTSLKQVRANSTSNIQDKLMSKSKHKKNKSFDRSQRLHSRVLKQQNNCASNLEGSFKQKMIQYAKILENQLAQKMKNNKTTGLQRIGQKSEKNSQLDDLTSCLTSKLKSKTPFQLVGDLLRNNTHIAKQINKYLPEVKHIQNQCEQHQKIFNYRAEQLQPFLQDIFYYKFQ